MALEVERNLAVRWYEHARGPSPNTAADEAENRQRRLRAWRDIDGVAAPTLTGRIVIGDEIQFLVRAGADLAAPRLKRFRQVLRRQSP